LQGIKSGYQSRITGIAKNAKMRDPRLYKNRVLEIPNCAKFGLRTSLVVVLGNIRSYSSLIGIRSKEAICSAKPKNKAALPGNLTLNSGISVTIC